MNKNGHQGKTGCPRPQGSSLPRPAKIYQTSGTEQGKVDFNTLKFKAITRKESIFLDNYLPHSRKSVEAHQ